jgi:glycosyltransferase involved in cell wall biosynthesis
VFSTILDTGGVEAWFWTLFAAVFSRAPYVVHAVQINDLWSEGSAAHFVREGVLFNPGMNYLVDTCDVIVSTGSLPLPAPRLQRAPPTVLVIHGSKGCAWTWRYAQHAARYDFVVGVSAGAVAVLDELPAEAARARVIHSGVDLAALVPRASRDALLRAWGVPLRPGLRVLLYLGRISSEKNPQYFMDVVEALPPEWVGVMVGPAYYDASFPQRASPRFRARASRPRGGAPWAGTGTRRP